MKRKTDQQSCPEKKERKKMGNFSHEEKTVIEKEIQINKKKKRI